MAAPWASGAKMRLIGRLHGQDCINVLHFATNTVINDPTQLAQLLTQLAIAMIACAIDNLMNATTEDYQLLKVECIQIHPTKGDVIEQVPQQVVKGLLSPASHSFAASLVQIRTGLGGRTHRGRFFLPPVGEAETTNSLITDGAMASITAFLNCVAGKFIGAGATEPWRLGVLSTKTLKATNSFDQAFTEALNLVPTNVVARMGSRKVGKGS
jgi:hypothetical protein